MRPRRPRADGLQRSGFGLVLLPLLLVSVLVGNLDARWWENEDAELFIGHADQASVADAARSIAQGDGPIVNNLWNKVADPGFEPVLPHREPYWAIYPAYVMAPFFLAMDEGRHAVLAAASLMKAITAISAAWLVFILRKRSSLALAAGLVLLVDPLMVTRVNGLADIYFAAAVTASVAFLVTATQRQGWRWFALAGLASGAVMGFRPPLGFVALVPPLIGVIHSLARSRSVDARRHALVILVAGLTIAPWLAGNLSSFDSPLPPGYARVSEAAAVHYETGNWDYAAYDPAATTDAEYTLIDPGRASAYLASFARGLLTSRVVPIWLLILGLVHGAIAWRSQAPRGIHALAPTRAPGGLAVQLLGFWALVGVVFATQSHFEARYWTFLLPVAVIGLFGCWPDDLGASRRVQQVGVVALVLASLAGGTRHYLERSSLEVVTPAYELATASVPPGSVVLTPNPWEFAYHTRLSSIALPYTNDPDVIVDIAERYGARYMVIIEGDARHPTQLRWLDDGMPEVFKTISDGEDLYIAEISGVE